jgi:hypothetical protein
MRKYKGYAAGALGGFLTLTSKQYLLAAMKDSLRQCVGDAIAAPLSAQTARRWLPLVSTLRDLCVWHQGCLVAAVLDYNKVDAYNSAVLSCRCSILAWHIEAVGRSLLEDSGSNYQTLGAGLARWSLFRRSRSQWRWTEYRKASCSFST